MTSLELRARTSSQPTGAALFDDSLHRSPRPSPQGIRFARTATAVYAQRHCPVLSRPWCDPSITVLSSRGSVDSTGHPSEVPRYLDDQ
jgi:hypothetical protein